MSIAPCVLLVKLPYKNSYYDFYVNLPAALGILSEVLLSHDIAHDIYDMQLNESAEDFYQRVESLQPKIIGFSMLTFRYLDNYKFLNEVKARFPKIPIVVGGPHASTFREEILKECSAVDIVVPLEGEDILVELCQHKPLKEIDGIIYREHNEIIHTAPRDFIQNLDQYPFPKFSKFDLTKYSAIPVITSRGCPYSCIYCPIATTIGKKWRAKSSAFVVDELAYWADRDIPHEIQIEDDNFTLDMNRVRQICEGIKKRGLLKKLNLGLGNGIRADRVNLELLTLMREIGVNVLAFGVESGVDQTLKTLKKGEDLATIEKAIQLACGLDFDVQLFFVIGAPSETEDDVRTSIALSQKYPVVDIAFYHLIPFPGTELYEWVKANNRFRFKNPDYLNNASHWVNEPLFTTDELGIEKRKELYHLANTSGRKYTNKIMSQKMAKRLSQKYHLPYSFVYPSVAFARQSTVKKILKKMVRAKRYN
ncbi:MAG: hypothetical protein A3C55_04160 [Gammaproteobacteria bacterium RIFCSPHIGHO2_02_FULL_42_13]|nr:MAG: hypothetical protein A3C55_04160 [Gammaproteobacteria bacterium RIFCSPHIGHO2_02_FULL_42_13]OGT68877.1 MAG: hypothetical protein A3H43_03810 [Gammaproteobacteria bacterium RIFCSPLOWO2_02_FULL_42_9]